MSAHLRGMSQIVIKVRKAGTNKPFRACYLFGLAQEFLDGCFLPLYDV
jgi:hypothetical protein